MARFEKHGFTISISIDKDYIVIANILLIDKESKGYEVTLSLKRNDIGRIDTLDEEHYPILSDNVNTDVCNFIVDKYNKGFFTKYINRYESEIHYLEKLYDDAVHSSNSGGEVMAS